MWVTIQAAIGITAIIGIIAIMVTGARVATDHDLPTIAVAVSAMRMTITEVMAMDAMAMVAMSMRAMTKVEEMAEAVGIMGTAVTVATTCIGVIHSVPTLPTPATGKRLILKDVTIVPGRPTIQALGAHPKRTIPAPRKANATVHNRSAHPTCAKKRLCGISIELT